MSRIFVLIAALGALFVGTTHLTGRASPGAWEEYDEAAFMMAQKKGRTIVVAIVPDAPGDTAALNRLMDEPLPADALYMTLDGDGKSAFVAAHGIGRGPAIVVFEGMDMIARAQPGELPDAGPGAI